MIQADREENKEIIKESVNYLEKRGFEQIRANLEGYEAPKSYLKKDSDVVITPDIVASRAGIKYYFEISLKTEKLRLLKSKWQFLDTITRMRNQRFKIITRRGHYKFTDELLKDLNLEKNLIKL
ncbi:hypothetical protein [Aequorivita xiaoshiensis]|uniref:Uncharacterized protein n=1 Tax=Aequorivita xiaoshiensis TaxID=2874476 RepID=A0A9X1R167_9FLAO|nr:hypothetical protein [Aequorivita xiaoshiensis]MCG2429937.1 hypothetical protein [Aequorivita xiaoshiensis]